MSSPIKLFLFLVTFLSQYIWNPELFGKNKKPKEKNFKWYRFYTIDKQLNFKPVNKKQRRVERTEMNENWHEIQ